MLTTFLASTRNRIIAGGVAGALVLGGVAFALTSGGGDKPPPTTTTTTTAVTTTVPPPTTTPAPIAPLTGVLADPALIARPALVVKIDNVEPKARPQVGLNQADVVYEERVEGSVTRLLAIFHSTDSAPVGPVRSGRTSDIAVLSMLHKPFFAWSGANGTFAARIRASNITDVGYDVASDHYFRAGDRHAPDNLMLRSTGEMMTAPQPGSAPPPALFPFRAPGQLPSNLEPIAGVHIVFGTTAGNAPVDYRWVGGGWARSQNGSPHVDSNGLQVTPQNVIIQFTPYAPTDVGDQFGVLIPEAQLVGEGDAWVLTVGGLVHARWHKPTLDAVTSYTDANGASVGLTPGQTWVALAPPGSASIL